MIPQLVIRFHRHGDAYPVTRAAYGLRETQRLAEEVPVMEADPKVLYVVVVAR